MSQLLLQHKRIVKYSEVKTPSMRGFFMGLTKCEEV